MFQIFIILYNMDNLKNELLTLGPYILENIQDRIWKFPHL